MGHSASAHVHYGYILNDGDGGWLIDGVGEYGEFPEAAGYEDDDITEQMESRLLVAHGLEDFGSYWAEGYYDRKELAENASGVQIRLGGYEYSTSMLIVRDVEAVAYAGAEVLTLPTLPDDADEKLAKALEILGIEPNQGKPSWILSANYG